MKKIFLFFILLLLSIVHFGIVANSPISHASQAGATPLSRVRSVRHSAKDGVQSITINIEKFGELKINTLTDPDRCVMDIGAVSVPSRQQRFDINHGSIIAIRYAQFDAVTARIVVDFTKKTDYVVKTGKGYIKIEAMSGAPDAAGIISAPDYSADSSVAAAPGSASASASASESASANNTGINDAALPTGASDKTPRPASDTEAASTPAPVPAPDLSPSAQDDNTTQTQEESPVGPSAPRNSFSLDSGKSLRIAYSCASGNDIVEITTDKDDRVLQGVVFSDLRSPLRLAIDLPFDAYVGPRQMQANTDVIKVIEVLRRGKSETRVVIELHQGVGYEKSIANGVIKITLKNKNIKNVGYSNYNNRPIVSLYRTYLTAGGEALRENYSIQYDRTGRVCTIKFENSLGSTGEGNFAVEDKLVSSIAVSKDTRYTTLTITAKSRIHCSVFTTVKPDGNLFLTNISLFEPYEKSDRVLVIDAGHGGHDPGTVGEGHSYEKDFCLDIALRVESNLRRRGVKTFMTRNSDTFIDLYERAFLANTSNADLFLSIHINSATNLEANGVETLFHPYNNGSSVTSEVFASIVQKNTVKSMNATDRQIKERPNLVVLRKTNMPAVLFEAGFLSNKNDLAKLNSIAYRRMVARAISDSVMEAFDTLGK